MVELGINTMRQTTRFMTYAVAIAVAAPLAVVVGTGAGVAGAGTLLPFAQMLRRCDFSETDYNGPTGMGRPFGLMQADGNLVTYQNAQSSTPGPAWWASGTR